MACTEYKAYQKIYLNTYFSHRMSSVLDKTYVAGNIFYRYGSFAKVHAVVDQGQAKVHAVVDLGFVFRRIHPNTV